ncbi:MAG: acyl-CoA thioesterase [Clostridia bacterium]|nr:acyl-CoA thioesterase [Clostridia bacterium]
MEYIYERKVNYYETDKMGVVHHSNYIRFLEEARCYWMREIGMPFETLEENGITIPVLGVNCTYKYHVTFGDTIVIKPFVKEYSGVRMTVGYNVTDKKTGKIILNVETKHCFTNKELKPVNLKKVAPEFNEKFEKLFNEYKGV